MRIFQLYPDGEYEFLTAEDEDDLEQLGELDATSRAADWAPVPVGIGTTDEDTGSPLRRADFPWLGSWSLVLRDQAIDLAGPVLEPFGEILPLTCPDARIALFNPLVVLDALDENHSQLVRFPDGDLMVIEKYVFSSRAVPERSIFKIPQERSGAVFYTEPVVDELRGLGLAGLDFKLLWDSDAD
ncbi:hypothetical protein ACWDWO_16780 [Actinopolymorpha singaporensis]|uniref:Uncharacterized protein n=1 Tax=Actinopolymorpha singaporensis TaxID=117157 RepID=A0A1H1RQ42_9ACTN|nr:hypothetical protein [Actinopolymorpha singaporensis]SDS37855.1 hypothetical protein SAMN04489717_2503 [Actinopolymorpha singaporensis]